MRPGRLGLGVGGVLAGLTAYLAAWPTGLQPVAWTPPPAPGLTGPYERNRHLQPVQWIARGAGVGPEATAFDAQGRLYTGLADGRILRLAPEGGSVATFVNTNGRPLGMSFDSAGNLIVADAAQGLLSVSPDGTLRVLAREHGGVPFRLVDDVAVATDGTVYFTDATSRFPVGRYRLDFIEHRPNGRLLAYHPSTGATEQVMGGLFFANGVAVSPDQAFVLVCESSAYQVRRVWRRGPRKGRSDVVIDNLPGFPDNVTASPRGDVFWLALASPRHRTLDRLLPFPRLRQVVARLPSGLQPKPGRHAFVLALDRDGAVRFNLQDDSPGAYAPVTSVREHEGYLYLGSVEREAVGRVPAPAR